MKNTIATDFIKNTTPSSLKSVEAVCQNSTWASTQPVVKKQNLKT